jgi:hypothetical protein
MRVLLSYFRTTARSVCVLTKLNIEFGECLLPCSRLLSSIKKDSGYNMQKYDLTLYFAWA